MIITINKFEVYVLKSFNFSVLNVWKIIECEDCNSVYLINVVRI